MKQETFDVIGMTCAACQANVTRAVQKLPGVDSVDVSLLNNTMKVTYDPAQQNAQAIEAAVDKIGYQALAQNQKLNESGQNDMQAQWEARQERTRAEIREKKRALISSLILLVVLMCFSMLPMLGVFTFLMDMEWMMVSAILQLVLSMIILFIQRSFFFHGFKSLSKGAPNMDSLVAIGSSVSFLYGLYGILRMAYGYGIMDHAIIHASMDALYFESAAMIVTLVSLGKYLEARSKAKTGDALGKLVDLAPKTAVIERDGVELSVGADQVLPGDLVIVRPGQRIPVDGIVASGIGYVDQAAITGESVPVEKQAGDEVMSASINVNGTFKFTATRVGADTTLSQIIRLVDEAGNSKAPIARLADKVSGIFVPVVLVLALLTLAGWLLAGYGMAFALNCAVCVLVISCPCALGLATPLAIMVSTGKAAEYGILIKSAASLETLHSIQTVVLDKTGTITNGKPEVTSIHVLEPNLSQEAFLQLAADAEMGSEHPLGKAIVEKARSLNLSLEQPSFFEAVGGRGLKALVGGSSIFAGNLAFMKDMNIPISKNQQELVHQMSQSGQTPLLFARNDHLMGMIGVADTVRSTSRDALQALKKMGIEVVMLTGDNERTAKAIASSLPIDRVIADVLPADKESVIRSLQEEGKKTAMVGDGINDAPALMRADVGIAIGAGTDIAIESADIVLMKDNLMDVVTAIDLSRRTITNIKENLFWAFFYNCLGIPVAAGLLYPMFGLLLNPMFGAAAMSLSSVTVCLNALRLRLFHPKNESSAQLKAQKVSPEARKQEEQTMAELPQILEEQALREENNSILLEVDNMTCDHCRQKVQNTLQAIQGVRSVQVSLESHQAFVLSDGQVQPDSLIQALEAAGYPARILQQNSITPLEMEAEQPAETDKQPGETQEKAESASSDSPGESAPSNESEKEPVYEYQMELSGLNCMHCVNRVTKALQKQEDVLDVSVTLDPQQAIVQSSRANQQAALKEAVEQAGYEVLGLQEKAVEPVCSAQPESDSLVYDLHVEGMTCSHCAGRVEKALKALPDVKDAEVSLETHSVTIKAGSALPEQEVLEAVRNAGYEPTDFHKSQNAG